MNLRRLVLLLVLPASCDDRALLQPDPDPSTIPTLPGLPDAGPATAVPAVPGSCLGTMASFNKGLLQDLESVVGPPWRDRNNYPAVEGVTVGQGYGVDLATLTIGFSVGRPWIAGLEPSTGDPTLSFGGWRTSSSPGRDPKALRAAEQLWSALAAGTERTEGSVSTRMTPGKRAACSRQELSDGGSLAVHCVLTGFLSLDAAEIPCE